MHHRVLLVGVNVGLRLALTLEGNNSGDEHHLASCFSTTEESDEKRGNHRSYFPYREAGPGMSTHLHSCFREDGKRKRPSREERAGRLASAAPRVKQAPCDGAGAVQSGHGIAALVVWCELAQSDDADKRHGQRHIGHSSRQDMPLSALWPESGRY